MSQPGLRIFGKPQLMKKFRNMETAVKKKLGRRATAAAIRPIRMEAKANAPAAFGILKKRLTVKVKTYKSGNAFGMVSVSNDAKDEATGRRPSKYLHLVSLGTKPHAVRIRKKKALVGTKDFSGSRFLKDSAATNQFTKVIYGVSVQHPGSRPNEFLKKAIASKERESLRAFSRILRRGIIAEARK